MLGFLKGYYIFMLILMVLSYLVPKEEYKNYIQFFVGVFVIVLLLEPVLTMITTKDPTLLYDIFTSFNEKIKSLDLTMEEEEGLFEYFFFKGERE